MGSGAYYSPSEITIYNYDWVLNYSTSSKKTYSFYSEDAHSSSHCRTASTSAATISKSYKLNFSDTWYTDYDGYPNGTWNIYVPYDNCIFGTYKWSNSYKYYTMHGSGIGNKKHTGTATLTLTFCDPQHECVSADSTTVNAQATSWSFTFSSTKNDVDNFVSYVNGGGLTISSPGYAIALTSYTAERTSTTVATVTLKFARNALTDSYRIARVFVTEYSSSVLITLFQKNNISSTLSVTSPTNATNHTVVEYDDITRVLDEFPTGTTDYSGASVVISSTTSTVSFKVKKVTLIDADGSETYSVIDGAVSFTVPMKFTVYATAYEDNVEVNGWAQYTIYAYLTLESTSIAIRFGRYYAQSKVVAIPYALVYNEDDTPTYISYSATTLTHALYRALSTTAVGSTTRVGYIAETDTSDKYKQYGSVSFTAQLIGMTSSGDFAVRITCEQRDLSYSNPLLIGSDGAITLLGDASVSDTPPNDASLLCNACDISIVLPSRRYCKVTVTFDAPTSLKLFNRIFEYYTLSYRTGARAYDVIKKYYESLSQTAIVNVLTYEIDGFVQSALGVNSNSKYAYIGTNHDSLEAGYYTYSAKESSGSFSCGSLYKFNVVLDGDGVGDMSFGFTDEEYTTVDAVRYLMVPSQTSAGSYTGEVKYKIQLWFTVTFTLTAAFKYLVYVRDLTMTRTVETTLTESLLPEFNTGGNDKRFSLSWDGDYVLIEWTEAIYPTVNVESDDDDEIDVADVSLFDEETTLTDWGDTITT